MSDYELLEIARIYDERKLALAEAEENLHVAMAARQAARQARRDLRTVAPRPRLLAS